MTGNHKSGRSPKPESPGDAGFSTGITGQRQTETERLCNPRCCKKVAGTREDHRLEHPPAPILRPSICNVSSTLAAVISGADDLERARIQSRNGCSPTGRSALGGPRQPASSGLPPHSRSRARSVASLLIFGDLSRFGRATNILPISPQGNRDDLSGC